MTKKKEEKLELTGCFTINHRPLAATFSKLILPNQANCYAGKLFLTLPADLQHVFFPEVKNGFPTITVSNLAKAFNLRTDANFDSLLEAVQLNSLKYLINESEKSSVIQGKVNILNRSLSCTILSIENVLEAKENRSHLTIISIGAAISLSELPLIGQYLPADLFKLKHIHFVYNSKTPAIVNSFLSENLQEFSIQSTALLEGFTVYLETNQSSNSKAELISFPLSNCTATKPVQSTPRNNSEKGEAQPIPTEEKYRRKKKENTGWQLGPINLELTSLNWEQNKIWISCRLEAKFLGLSFYFVQLSLGFSPNKMIQLASSAFLPEIRLKGIGIGFKNSLMELSGMLYQSSNDPSYRGIVTIKLPQITIRAVAAYSHKNGNSAFFVFGVLQLATGFGAPFLRITGFSVGFGYNYSALIPEAEGIPNFPLVSLANRPPATWREQWDTLEKISDDFSIQKDALFIAVGIKFSVFEIIDGYALLLINTGDSPSINVLGTATVCLPKEKSSSHEPAIAAIELSFLAQYDFAEKALKIKAVITNNSYLLDPKWHLTGGVALYTWMGGEYAGDFVFTAGGYHPDYLIPSHYPRVPRIGFNFELGGLIAKGEVYFALTPSAIMAGMYFSAIWQSESCRIGFILSADFLVCWKPFQYYAQTFVCFFIHCRFLFCKIDLNLSAELQLWGPSFGGIATLDLGILSINVKFGDSAARPSPLTWSQFADSFLPEKNKICTLSVVEGILKKINENEFVVSGSSLEITVNTTIPCLKTGDSNDLTIFGIRPMSLPQVYLSKLTMRIENETVTNLFCVSSLEENVPVALWSSQPESLNENPTLKAVLGYSIRPKEIENTSATEKRNLEEFLFSQMKKEAKCALEKLENITFQRISSARISSTFQPKESILNALGLPLSSVQTNGLQHNIKQAFYCSPLQTH
jgi:hypothetical protein